MANNEENLTDNPLWYQEAIIYELPVRAFYDGDGDGTGDFQGLIQKLDYLRSLGVTALWLLPFYPSPLKDDGYDVADYTGVHPVCGELEDFKQFVREAHCRGLRVITELICSHTSDQHPWFQQARRAKPGSPRRDFYVWSETPDKYPEARVIFSDSETSNWAWDPVAKAYYWHRFYSHQPHLNYDNPAVPQAIRQAADFWLELGVDGLRLVGLPYLYQREGTDCENLPETREFLTSLRRHVDRSFKNRILLTATKQWPQDAAAYFGQGDACHLAFYTPLMPRLFMGVQMEDRFPIIDILHQSPPVPDDCRWGLFLRNHDELTLEIATDAERDYMVRIYANEAQSRFNLGIRRRLAPLLGNDRHKIELLNGLLFSLPGTPTLYYGDEIGLGDNIYLPDRKGVRTPMHWSADRNAGFSPANPQRLYLPVNVDPAYHYQAVNVETQQNNPQSLLWWMRRLIALRKRCPVLSHGDLTFLSPDNHHVLAFLRSNEAERILVVANLSRFIQHVSLDLAAFRDMVPVELFGRAELPPLGEDPYRLMLGPYAFYWLALQPHQRQEPDAPAGATTPHLPILTVAGSWEEVFHPENKPALENILPAYIAPRRWFGSKARTIQTAAIVEAIAVTGTAFLTLVQVAFTEGEPETYMLPLAFATDDRAETLRQEQPGAIIARLQTRTGAGVLYDAVWETSFCAALPALIVHRRQLEGTAGALLASATSVFTDLYEVGEQTPPPSLLGAEQSNTSIRYGDRLILKLFRKLEMGTNPDLEIGHFLTEKSAFTHTPPVAGMLEYRRVQTGEPITLAILQGFVTNRGDAWRYTLEALERYFERVLSQSRIDPAEIPLPRAPLLELVRRETPLLAHEMIGPYLEAARLLGRRTAELHLALAGDAADPNFAPEPFTAAYQRPLHQSMRNLTGRVLHLLRRRFKTLPETVRAEAQQALELEPEILGRFRSLVDHRLTSLRTRIHGDYHLGQVLYTGKDFMIIDFEGEPARTLKERRQKKSPWQDVAGMLRSFHYAAYAVFFDQVSLGIVPTPEQTGLENWIRFWHGWVSAAFLKSYLAAAAGAPFQPKAAGELNILLEAYLLEKAVYELGYELNNRPDWVKIPLQGILQTLGQR